MRPFQKCVKLVEKKEFAAAVLDPKHKAFVIHIESFNSTSFNVRPQISGLIAKKALTKISTKYLDFVDVFSLDLASKLLEHTGINDHTIELVDS